MTAGDLHERHESNEDARRRALNSCPFTFAVPHVEAFRALQGRLVPLLAFEMFMTSLRQRRSAEAEDALMVSSANAESRALLRSLRPARRHYCGGRTCAAVSARWRRESA